jgi:hypothetical protein
MSTLSQKPEPLQRMEIVLASEMSKWDSILEETSGYDFYHLAEYHALAEANGEGRAVLFVYREQGMVAAWPFLLRDLNTVEGLEAQGDGYCDCTSVYGYPGPVMSAPAQSNPGFIDRFLENLGEVAVEQKIVSLFSRLNPVLGNASFLQSTAGLECKGQTVYIDLRNPPDVQMSLYRWNHRNGIRKARRNGVCAYDDKTWEHLDSFLHLYEITMNRVGAQSWYYFKTEYFHALREALGSRLHLFVAEKDGRPVSTALFVRTGSIIQYHLGASDDVGLLHAASKVIMDQVRIWGTQTGAAIFHLGGGVGVQEDSLFRFKSGFSPLRYDFFVWKKILLPERYNLLVQSRLAWLSKRGKDSFSDSFFPLYRADSSNTAMPE